MKHKAESSNNTENKKQKKSSPLVQEGVSALIPVKSEKAIDLSVLNNFEAIPGLPNDIFYRICSFLPAYSFFGTNSVHMVSKKWDALLQSQLPEILSKKNKSALFESAQELAGAQYLLTDELIDVSQRLTFNEYLQLVGMHPEISKRVIDNLTPTFTYWHLIELGKNSFVTRELIFSHEKARQKVDGFVLAMWGKQSVPTAHRILGDDELNSKLSGSELLCIARESLEISTLILSDRKFSSKLSIVEKIALGKNYFEIAHQLFREVIEQINTIDEEKMSLLSDLREAWPGIAHLILNDTTLKPRLTGLFLGKLAKAPEITERILADETLTHLLGDASIMLAQSSANAEIAMKILEKINIERFRDGWAKVGSKFPVVAKKILTDNDLRQKFINDNTSHLSLAAGLAELGRSSVENAKLILEHQEFQQELDGNNLAHLGKDTLEIARLVLADEMLRARLTGENLAELGSHLPEIASQILADKTLCRLLKGKDLAVLGSHLPKIAQQILTDETLRPQLREGNFGENVSLLGTTSFENTMLILNDEMLRNSLSAYDILKLANFSFNNAAKVTTFVLENNQLKEKLRGRASILHALAVTCKLTEQILADKTFLDGIEDYERFYWDRMTDKMNIVTKIRLIIKNYQQELAGNFSRYNLFRCRLM